MISIDLCGIPSPIFNGKTRRAYVVKSRPTCVLRNRERIATYVRESAPQYHARQWVAVRILLILEVTIVYRIAYLDSFECPRGRHTKAKLSNRGETSY